MRIQRLFAYASAACLVSLLPAPAMADVGSGNFNAFLQGTVSGQRNRHLFHGGRLLNQLGPSRRCSITFTGVITYDGRGHATLTDEGVDIGTGSPDRFVDEACDI